MVCPQTSPCFSSHPNLIGVIGHQNVDTNGPGKGVVTEDEACYSMSALLLHANQSFLNYGHYRYPNR